MSRPESVVASLHELRAIEHQRVADEATARAAEVARAEAAARVDRDAALALAAQREADAAAARRVDALAVACAAAGARARAESDLDAERWAQELRVRREQIARTRPLGLVAVIAALCLGGGALAVALVEQRADLAAREAEIHDVTRRADKLRDESDELSRAAHGLQIQVDQREAELAAERSRVAQLPAIVPTPHAPPAPRVAPAAAPRPPVVIDPSCAGSVLCAH